MTEVPVISCRDNSLWLFICTGPGKQTRGDGDLVTVGSRRIDTLETGEEDAAREKCTGHSARFPGRVRPRWTVARSH